MLEKKAQPYVPAQYLQQAPGNGTGILGMLPDCFRGRERKDRNCKKKILALVWFKWKSGNGVNPVPDRLHPGLPDTRLETGILASP